MALGGMCKQLDRWKAEASATTEAHSRGSMVAASTRDMANCEVASCRWKRMDGTSQLENQVPFQMVLIQSAATLGLWVH